MRVFLLAPAFLLACTGKNVDSDTGSGVVEREFSDCDPLSYDYCSLPFPSMYYMREDSATPTGYRVHIGATTLPVTHQGVSPNTQYLNELDGFSPFTLLLAQFPNMVLDGVPGHANIANSVADGSPFVLIDAETGVRQAAWAELDVSDSYVEGKEFLMIRSAYPLENGKRYVVGIRNIKDTSGATIPASDGFAALRDGTPTDDWDIEGRRDAYEAIFGALEQDGWTRSETQLAWDFIVGSKEGITGRATAVRDDMFSRVGTSGPPYTITSIDDGADGTGYNESIFRVVQGTFTAPLYTVDDGPGTFLTRDEDGQPYYNGDTTVPFTILIPRTAHDNPRPLPIMQYGHGLLGDQDEVFSGYLGEMANLYGFSIFAVNWTGMKGDDSSEIQLMIAQDIGNFAMIPERTHQGYTEFAAAARMMTGDMVNDDAMAFAVDGGDPTPILDPAHLWYYGNSQGGILGGAYLALNPDIPRGVLGVPGTPYSLLLQRSADFTPFFGLLQNVYPDQRDITFFMSWMQCLWDSGDASGYAAYMNADPLDGVAHQVLVQDAIGDAQVTTLGAQNMARAYGAVQVTDSPYQDIYGVEQVSSPHAGSAIAEYFHNTPDIPFENLPPDDEYDTHEDTRRTFSAQEQLYHFLSTGEVVNYCDGTCDPD